MGEGLRKMRQMYKRYINQVLAHVSNTPFELIAHYTSINNTVDKNIERKSESYICFTLSLYVFMKLLHSK